MSLLGEAVRAALQPCSYSLLILAVVVLGLRGPRPRLPALGVFFATTTLAAWIPFVGVNPLLDGRLAGTVGLVAGLVLAGWRTYRPEARSWPGMVGVALVGGFAGATWLPCVGEELGAVLTAATRDPWPGLPALALYLLGTMWVVIALAAITDYTPRLRRLLENARVVIGFRMVGAIVAVVVAVDLYPTVLSHLARISAL